ncbi:MAG: SUMF1/EgtB/PvdO family nonheme iron enzyme [Planctomycetes bacterium]|nr:SUMF1/EgtB/PvdO family nonheme iron enzyme [Planctomycetota bacterium]
MGQESTDSSDLLTVDERFFLHIALKNGLLVQAQADQAMAACRARDLSLEDALRALRLLDDAQVLKVREAMAASQVVRLDSVYADVAVAAGAASRAQVEAGLGEQRRQRYRVRLGNLLVDGGVITPEQHRAVITEVIRRLKQHGPEAYGSTVLRREAQAERTALGAGSEASSGIAGWTTPARPAPAPGPFTPRGPAASGLDNTAVETKGGGADALVESAIRIGLSSESGGFALHRSDEAALRRDLVAMSRSTAPDDSADDASASFVLDRVALAAPEGGFDPADYVARRRRRQRALLLAGGAGGAALLAVVLSAVLAAVSNRHALRDVRALMGEAQAARDPEAKRAAYLRASERLLAVGALGVSDEVRTELAERVRWGALEADALALLARGAADEARQLLERRRAEVPALAETEHAALVRQARREHALGQARAAEAAMDWVAAVAAYRDARDQGDPGSLAATRLAAIRADLLQRVDERYREAEASLSEADEAAFTREAKLLTELFNEGQGLAERLEELQYRRALARGEALLREDDLDRAQQALELARRLRPARSDVEPLLQRLGARRELKDEERRGRDAEARRRWAEAAEHYGRALERATREDDRRRLEDAAARARAEARKDQERRREAAQLEEAVAHLRAGRAREAQALLEPLASAPEAARLLALARRVEGMVYVPAGPFRMGSAPGDPGSRPHEQPQRTVDVPAFFIGRTEVTNAEYARFVATGEAPPPPHWTHPVRQPDGSVRTSFDPALADHPVVNVTWRQARAYAEWRGGRLPGEAQWEKAARGTDGRRFPWGEGTQVRAHVQVAPDRLRGHPTAPAGSFADDTSPYGAQDMAGNVGEWTDDPFAAYPGAPAGLEWPPGRRAIRGGAWRWRFEDARCAARDRGEEDGYVSPTVGLRVVVEVPAEVRELR